MRHNLAGIIFLLLFISPLGLLAQTGQKPTIDERLIRLEEKVDAVEKRLEDTNKRIEDVNKRIDDLRSDIHNQFENIHAAMNNRFSEVNNRFDDLRFWLGLIATIVLAILGGLFGMGLYIVKNLYRVESGVDGKAFRQSHSNELEEMQKRLAALEAQLKPPQAGPA